MISNGSIKAQAEGMGLTFAHLRAIMEVEANGAGFFTDPKQAGVQIPKVQYEPHVMYQRLVKNISQAKADAAAREYPTLVSKKPGSYQSLSAENADMDRAAKEIDRVSAFEASSWGSGQIMGYWWKDIGFASIQAFVNAQYTDEGQLDTLCRFLKANPAIILAAKAQNWAEVARRYNGPNYAQNRYDTKLRDAFAKWSR